MKSLESFSENVIGFRMVHAIIGHRVYPCDMGHLFHEPVNGDVYKRQTLWIAQQNLQFTLWNSGYGMSAYRIKTQSAFLK